MQTELLLAYYQKSSRCYKQFDTFTNHTTTLHSDCTKYVYTDIFLNVKKNVKMFKKAKQHLQNEIKKSCWNDVDDPETETIRKQFRLHSIHFSFL